MRFTARLDMSHHGPPHPFKEAEVDADSLTEVIGCTTEAQSTNVYIW
jgi:hypothetical protein